MADQDRNLVTKLAAILGGVERIEKKGKNTFHNYQYVMEADLVESVRGELAKAHIIITTGPMRVERVEVQKTNGNTGIVTTNVVPLLFIEYTFRDGESGETIVVHGVGEIDQDGGKGIYKAQTGAMKYMLMKNFLIATGDDPEQDDRKKPATAAAPKPANPGGRTYNAGGDKKFPATAPQVACINRHWDELTGPEKSEFRTVRENAGIPENGVTKAQASFLIDELMRIKGKRGPGGGAGFAQVPTRPQGGPLGMIVHPGPKDGPPREMGQAAVDLTIRTIHSHDAIHRLEGYMEDVRAWPKSSAEHAHIEREYKNRIEFLHSRP